MMFEAYNPAKPGPFHGNLTSTPYVTKDLIQAKRFKAHKMGTTYVYDFLPMFKESVDKIWKGYALKGDWGINMPDTRVS